MKQALLLLIGLLVLLSSAAGRGAENGSSKARSFYRDKTITWMVGSTPGGSVDRISRLFAPFLEKHTGAKVVVQNRPGGNGAATFNYIYKNAKPDGLSLGFHIASTQMLSKIAKRAGLRFDLEKLSWIGVVSPVANTFLAYKKRFASLDDVKRVGRVRWGLTRPGGNNHFQGVTLSKVLGIEVQFVPGYTGSAAVRQALMSGEVDVAAFPANLYRTAIEEGLVVPLIHMGRKRHPAAPDTPTLFEVVKKIPSPLDSWVDIGQVGYFLAGTPQMPPERLEFLRAALKKSVSDPHLLAKAEKQQFVIEYLSPEESLKVVRGFLGQSDSDKEKLRQFLKGKK